MPEFLTTVRDFANLVLSRGRDTYANVSFDLAGNLVDADGVIVDAPGDKEYAQFYSRMFNNQTLDAMVDGGPSRWYGFTVSVPMVIQNHSFALGETRAA